MRKFLKIIGVILVISGCSASHEKITIEDVAPAKSDLAITEVVEEKIR